jgi:hypothetical protein
VYGCDIDVVGGGGVFFGVGGDDGGIIRNGINVLLLQVKLCLENDFQKRL